MFTTSIFHFVQQKSTFLDPASRSNEPGFGSADFQKILSRYSEETSVAAEPDFIALTFPFSYPKTKAPLSVARPAGVPLIIQFSDLLQGLSEAVLSSNHSRVEDTGLKTIGTPARQATTHSGSRNRAGREVHIFSPAPVAFFMPTGRGEQPGALFVVEQIALPEGTEIFFHPIGRPHQRLASKAEHVGERQEEDFFRPRFWSETGGVSIESRGSIPVPAVSAGDASAGQKDAPHFGFSMDVQADPSLPALSELMSPAWVEGGGKTGTVGMVLGRAGQQEAVLFGQLIMPDTGNPAGETQNLNIALGKGLSEPLVGKEPVQKGGDFSPPFDRSPVTRANPVVEGLERTSGTREVGRGLSEPFAGEEPVQKGGEFSPPIDRSPAIKANPVVEGLERTSNNPEAGKGLSEPFSVEQPVQKGAEVVGEADLSAGINRGSTESGDMPLLGTIVRPEGQLGGAGPGTSEKQIPQAAGQPANAFASRSASEVRSDVNISPEPIKASTPPAASSPSLNRKASPSVLLAYAPAKVDGMSEGSLGQQSSQQPLSDVVQMLHRIGRLLSHAFTGKSVSPATPEQVASVSGADRPKGKESVQAHLFPVKKERSSGSEGDPRPTWNPGQSVMADGERDISFAQKEQVLFTALSGSQQGSGRSSPELNSPWIGAIRHWFARRGAEKPETEKPVVHSSLVNEDFAPQDRQQIMPPGKGHSVQPSPDSSTVQPDIPARIPGKAQGAGAERVPFLHGQPGSGFIHGQNSVSVSHSPHAGASFSEQVWESVERWVKQAHLQVGTRSQEMVIRLQPESLGIIRIRLQMKDQVLQGQLEASQPETVRLLQQQQPALIGRMQEMGIQVQQMEISLNNQPGFQQSASHPGQQHSGRSTGGAFRQEPGKSEGHEELTSLSGKQKWLGYNTIDVMA